MWSGVSHKNLSSIRIDLLSGILIVPQPFGGGDNSASPYTYHPATYPCITINQNNYWLIGVFDYLINPTAWCEPMLVSKLENYEVVMKAA